MFRNDYFYLKDAVNESIENFKLIVSTEKVDDFLLAQKDLELGKMMAAGTRSIRLRRAAGQDGSSE